MVTFEQNLAEIFAFDTRFEISYEPHIILVNSKEHTLYSLGNGNLISEDLPELGKNLS